MKLTVLTILIGLAAIVLSMSLFVFVMLALYKYIKKKEVRKEQEVIRETLKETLKRHRMKCNMTQEFVAEVIGVSRQAVSKWENGTSDPSTSNLIALAKLYDVSVETLLKGVRME